MKELIVIVIDVGNYKAIYREPTPFKAIIKDVYENQAVVVSLATNNEYELYEYQILEFLDIDEIKELLK